MLTLGIVGAFDECQIALGDSDVEHADEGGARRKEQAGPAHEQVRLGSLPCRIRFKRQQAAGTGIDSGVAVDEISRCTQRFGEPRQWHPDAPMQLPAAE